MARSRTSATTARIETADKWPLANAAELWRARRILLVLAQRSIKVRYQQTALGIAWVVLQPLFLVLIISVFMGFVLGRGDRLGLEFPVFLFPAWVAWRTLNKVTNEGARSIAGNGALVQRIYLPRLFFPLAVALSSAVDLVFLVLALLVLLLVYATMPGPGLLALPLILAILYACAVGVAMVFAAATVRYRDMEILTPLLTQVWFWSSPIIYPSVVVPEQYRSLYYLNPMAVVIDGTRWAFTQTAAPPPEAWILGSLVAGILLVGGYVYFRRREPLFADLMGE